MSDPTKVSWYGPDGSKVRTLVFVLIRSGEVTYVFNVNWTQDAGNDSNFYRDAVKHLVSQTSLLDNISKLYISGDHGPHFSSRKTFFFESTVHGLSKKWRARRKDGLEIECQFLASYHAFNRCDGAGMFLKWACMMWWREGGINSWPCTAAQICEMINNGLVGSDSSKNFNMVGFSFDTIDYGEDVYEAVHGDGSKDPGHVMDRIRQRCSVKYMWTQMGQPTRLEGVMCVRDVSGIGPWQFIDVLHSRFSERGVMCEHHTRAVHHPVYHGKMACVPINEAISDADRVQPSMLRMAHSGPQKNPKHSGTQRSSKDDSTLTLATLKLFLASKGLKQSGNKKELVRRARAFEETMKEFAQREKEYDEAQPDDDEDDEDDEEEEEEGYLLDIWRYNKVCQKSFYPVLHSLPSLFLPPTLLLPSLVLVLVTFLILILILLLVRVLVVVRVLLPLLLLLLIILIILIIIWLCLIILFLPLRKLLDLLIRSSSAHKLLFGA